MRMLRLELVYDLGDDFQGGLLDALQAAMDFLKDPDRGLDAPPQAACFGTQSGAFVWNRTLGINLMMRGGIHDLTGIRWTKFPPLAPPRLHADEKDEVFLK